VAPNKGLSANKIISCVFHGFDLVWVLHYDQLLSEQQKGLKCLCNYSIRKTRKSQRGGGETARLSRLASPKNGVSADFGQKAKGPGVALNRVLEKIWRYASAVKN